MVLRPKVSVLTIARNAEPFLDTYFKSFESQDLKEIEIVIVVSKINDDRTYELLTERAAKDPRIKIYDGPDNETHFTNRAMAYENATGEYIINLDIDDFWDPHYIDLLYGFAKKNDLDYVVGNLRNRHENDGSCDPVEYLFDGDRVFETEQSKIGLFKGRVNHSLHLVKKELLEKHGYTYQQGELILHSYMFERNVKVGYVHDAVFNYLIRSSSLSRKGAIRIRKEHFIEVFGRAQLVIDLDVDPSIRKYLLLLTYKCYIFDLLLIKMARPAFHYFKNRKKLKKMTGCSFFRALRCYRKFSSTDGKRLLAMAAHLDWVAFLYFKRMSH